VLSEHAYNVGEMPTYSLPVAVVGGVFALAACGSAGKPTASGSSRSSAAFLRYSECMRARGVPNFPDPPAGGGIHITASSGLDPESPAFQAAMQTCRKLLPGGGPPRIVPESAKLRLLNHAECMRAHGVPGYPDPTFPAGGGVESFFPSNVEFGAPVFEKALKACGGRE
jgi:hypothetical protein